MPEDLNPPAPQPDDRSAPGTGDAPDGDFGQRREFYTFAPETLGQELPEFEILRELGKGTMGIVFEARRRVDGERIALKLLPPSLTLTERALARFQREGRIMARIRHPDIVAVYEQGSRGRLHWFAMELVDGTTLQERLEVGPLPVRTACQICAQVARALQFAHDHGVVHRDIKPGNLMLRRTADVDAAPRAAITDFGLARETGTGSMTESGAIVGTPMFWRPNRCSGGTAQANTLGDVYSLGATLYAALTGRPPFDGPTAQSVLKAVLERQPPAPRSLRADLPRDVETIVAKAMAKEPGHRYGSALEFAEDLDRFLAGQRVAARRIGPVRRLVRAPAGGAARCRRCWSPPGIRAAGRHPGAAARPPSKTVGARCPRAERWLALAATSRDEQERPHRAGTREFALAAVSAASGDRSRPAVRDRLVRARQGIIGCASSPRRCSISTRPNGCAANRIPRSCISGSMRCASRAAATRPAGCRTT
ncbi:MAG: serine/threonine protein kinase [Planctomycetes bacterium]|nr:serine/threonine protein kinase [Planctomycetota bacterium]